jgi:hypothetical protein
MRRPISAACTGEPPGELTASATALSRGCLKARSIWLARPLRVRPARNGPSAPITPARRITATTGGGSLKRRIGKRSSSE